MARRSLPSPIGLLLLFAVAMSLTLLACGTERTGSNGESVSSETASSVEVGLIWEAWNLIKDSYVGGDDLDSQSAVGSAIIGMLDASGNPVYPFLTTLNDAGGNPPNGVPPELVDVWKAWTLHRETWPDFDAKRLAYAAVTGLLESLDDGTVAHLDPDDYAETVEQQKGTYEGIGAYVNILDGNLVLIPMTNSPAERAGLEAGDVLLEVEGKSVQGRSPQEVVTDVRGTPGTKVNLRVQRRGEDEPINVDVFRGDIDKESVFRTLQPGSIGYIYISDFRDNTPEEVITALEEFKRLDTLALILDLRNNPGGSLESARQIASQFLPQGLFMYEVDKAGGRRDRSIEAGGVATEDFMFEAETGGDRTELMVVLVNEFTSNAAEVLAGSLQDAHRADILGIRTIGRGSDNVYRELSDGSAIYLPVSNWYTPLGRRITGSGILPDIEVPITDEDRAQGLDTQRNVASEYLDNQLPRFR